MKKLLLFFAMMCALLVNAQEEQMPKGSLMNNPVPDINWPYSQQYLIDDGQNLDQWYNDGWMVSRNTAEINNYQANTTYLLLSETIQLPVLEDGHAINLVFNESFELESYHDIGEVLVSTDNGKSFECLASRSGKGALRNTYVNLNAYSGRDIMIAFRLKTDQSHNFDGWQISNVVIRYDKLTSYSQMVEASPILKSTSSTFKSTSTSEFVGLDANNFPNTVFAQAKIKDVNGNAILGLGNDDFTISERVDCSSELGDYDPVSKKAPFMVYPPADTSVSKPVDIVFLMDNSGSMSDEQNAVKDNVTRFVDSLESKGFDYSLAICKFGQGAGSGQPVLVPGTSGDWFNNDAEGFIQTWTDKMVVSGAIEPGYDALNHTAVNLSYRAGSQRLFIIITDEPNNGSNITDQNVILQNLQAQGINVYGILKSGSPTTSYSPLCSKVYDIFSSFTDILDDINTEINSTYTIRYEPREKAYDSCEHHVKIGIDPGTSANFDLTGKSYIPGDVIDVVRTDETINRLSNAQSQGADIPVTVKVTDLHKPYAEKVTLYYRVYSEANPNAFQSVKMNLEPSRSTNETSYWTANIDSGSIKTPTVEYYVKASDGNQTVTVPGFDKALWNFAVIPNYPPELSDSTDYKSQQEQYIDGETITFTVEAIDDDEFDLDGQTVQDAIDRVLLVYSHPSVVSPDGFETVEMTAQGNNIYTIDHVLQEGTTEYYFVAYDSYGSSTIYPVGADKNVTPNTNMLSITAIDSSCVPTITVSSAQACMGDTIEVNINTSLISDQCNYVSFQGKVLYDHTILEYIDFDVTGTLSEGTFPLAGVIGTDSLKVQAGFFTGDQFTGAGSLIKLKFRVVKEGESDLNMVETYFNNYLQDDINNGTVDANPIPEVELNDIETCVGHDAVFETVPASFSNYKWSDGSNGTTLSTSQPGTYWVEVTDNNGCKAKDTSELSTVDLPGISVSDISVCQGQTEEISISTGQIPEICDLSTFEFKMAFDGDVVDYVGYQTNGTIADGFLVGVNRIDKDTIKVGVLSLAGDFLEGSGELIRLEFKGLNAGNSDLNIGNFYFNNVHVSTVSYGNATVLSNPVAHAGPDQSICPGISATLEANGGLTYLWNNGSTSPKITVSPVDTTSYKVRVTNAEGCTDSDEVTVNLNPDVNVTGLSDVTVCSGNQANLSAEGGESYLWNSGQSSSSISVSPMSTTSYTVTVTNTYGCTGTDSATVIVNDRPVFDLGEDQNLCRGSELILTASGGSSYEWSTGATSATVTVSPSIDTKYLVTVTNDLSCSAVDSLSVSVLDKPSAYAGVDQEICPSVDVALSATGGGTYLWNTDSTSSSILVSPVATTSYLVTVTAANGCTDVDTVAVNVKTPEPVNVADASICMGDVATLDAGEGFLGYEWSTGDETKTTTVSKEGWYYVTITGTNGCLNQDSAYLTVYDLPVINLQDDTIFTNQYYSGQPGTLDAGPGFVSYNWSNGETTQTITSYTAGEYTVTVTDHNTCVNADRAEIIDIPFIYGDFDCDGEVLGFDAILLSRYVDGHSTDVPCVTSLLAADVDVPYGVINDGDVTAIYFYAFDPADTTNQLPVTKNKLKSLHNEKESEAIDVRAEDGYLVFYFMDTIKNVWVNTVDTENGIGFNVTDAEVLSDKYWKWNYTINEDTVDVSWIRLATAMPEENEALFKIKYEGTADKVIIGMYYNSQRHFDTVYLTEVNTTDEHIITLQDIKIYPVPVGNEVTVASPVDIEGYEVRNTASGISLLQRNKVNQRKFTINTSSLLPGHYTITFITRRGQKVVKPFIKK